MSERRCLRQRLLIISCPQILGVNSRTLGVVVQDEGFGFFCPNDFVPGMRILPHVEVTLQHVLDLNDNGHWLLSHFLGAVVASSSIAAFEILSELVVHAGLINEPHVQVSVEEQLPELVPGGVGLLRGLRMLWAATREISPGKARDEAVIRQDVTVALGVRQSIEAGIVTILDPHRRAKDLLGFGKSVSELLRLLKDPGHSIRVDVLGRLGGCSLCVVCVQLGPHPHEALWRRGTDGSTNAFTDLLCFVLKEMVDCMHRTEQQDDVGCLRHPVVILIIVLLFQAQPLFWHHYVLILPGPLFDLDVFTDESQLLANIVFDVLLLILDADAIEFLDCQSLQVLEAFLVLPVWIGPQPPVCNQPFYWQLIRLLAVTDLRHSSFQP
mmetsp:Transcript_88596/g.211544  ORF Transcript_88596/g.211544 Transcript_88596/m.211544 type:complete len:382 (-) Transcript_88596:779-1924(-)